MQMRILSHTQQLLTISELASTAILRPVSSSVAVTLSNVKWCLRPNCLSSRGRVRLSRCIPQFARNDAFKLRYFGLMTQLASSTPTSPLELS